jgi:hypothetical protein
MPTGVMAAMASSSEHPAGCWAARNSRTASAMQRKPVRVKPQL